MTDQVSSLNQEPKHFQIGEPHAPCNGSSTCTDCVISMIVLHETGVLFSAATVRKMAAPQKDPCRGLNPAEALVGLRALGVRGYSARVNATASDAIRATDQGVVLVAVGYDGFPLPSEAEVGGRTDLRFDGPHAISLWGRRYLHKPPSGWPQGKTFKPGWRVWTRDPDHHWGAQTPPYDRFASSYLVRAMDALVGNEGWQVRLAIGRFPTKPKARALAFLEPHTVEPLVATFDLDLLPEFGAGQQGGTP